MRAVALVRGIVLADGFVPWHIGLPMNTRNLEVRVSVGWIYLLEPIQRHDKQLDLLVVGRISAPRVDVLADENLDIWAQMIGLHGNASNGIVHPALLRLRHSGMSTRG